MNPAVLPSVDEITARLRAEDARLRHRTLWLTLLPVVVGVGVVGIAWWGVHEARLETAALDRRIQEQQGAINDMTQQRAALDREIAARRDLLDHYAARLPSRERAEVRRLQEGLADAQRGDTAAAIKAFESAIASDDGNALAYRLRGSALFAEGDHARASESLRQAIARDPSDAQARYMLGLSLWALDRRDEALAEIQRAFENDEVKARALQDPAFQPVRGLLDARAGQASAGTDAERVFIDEGLQAARRGEFAAAVAAYDKALAVNPRNARILNWRGYALYRTGDFGEAISSFERAIAIEPRAAETRYNLALAMWRSGRRDDAASSLARAYEADPSFEAIAIRDPQSRDLRAFAARKP